MNPLVRRLSKNETKRGMLSQQRKWWMYFLVINHYFSQFFIFLFWQQTLISMSILLIFGFSKSAFINTFVKEKYDYKRIYLTSVWKIMMACVRQENGKLSVDLSFKDPL